MFREPKAGPDRPIEGGELGIVRGAQEGRVAWRDQKDGERGKLEF